MQMTAYQFEEWNQSAVMAMMIMLTSAFFTILISLIIRPLSQKKERLNESSSKNKTW